MNKEEQSHSLGTARHPKPSTSTHFQSSLLSPPAWLPSQQLVRVTAREAKGTKVPFCPGSVSPVIWSDHGLRPTSSRTGDPGVSLGASAAGDLPPPSGQRSKLLPPHSASCLALGTPTSTQIVLPLAGSPSGRRLLSSGWPPNGPLDPPGRQVGANTGCCFCSQKTKFTATAKSVGGEGGGPSLGIKSLPRGNTISLVGVSELGPGPGVLLGPIKERTCPGRVAGVRQARVWFREMLRPYSSGLGPSV